MAFLLADDVKRYISETDFILQPRSMILGQITEPFFIQPTGQVDTFSVRFYPYGFANFAATSIKDFSNKETPLELVIGEKQSEELTKKIREANDTRERIAVVEDFLLDRFSSHTIIDQIVKSTIEALVATSGNSRINTILRDDLSKRRQMERNFSRQIGVSPKQLGKVIRLQAALKMLLNRDSKNLTAIAYEGEYYDQAHFIRDFKEFTGTTPAAFLEDENLLLSFLIYKNE